MRVLQLPIGCIAVASLFAGCATQTMDFESAELKYCSRQLVACTNDLTAVRSAPEVGAELPAAEIGECYALAATSAERARVWEQVACAIPSDQLQDLQRALRATGQYTGAVDGLLNENTMNALTRYSTANGLPVVTNAIATRTLRSLGVELREDIESQPRTADEERVLTALRGAVREVLFEYSKESDLYIEQGIPEDKLQNARAAAHAPTDERITGLINMTVFGSARKAVLFGGRGVYMTGETGPAFVSYADLPRLESKGDGPYYVLFSNGVRLNFAGSSFDSDEFTDLIDDLNDKITKIFGGAAP